MRVSKDRKLVFHCASRRRYAPPQHERITALRASSARTGIRDVLAPPQHERRNGLTEYLPFILRDKHVIQK